MTQILKYPFEKALYFFLSFMYSCFHTEALQLVYVSQDEIIDILTRQIMSFFY